MQRYLLFDAGCAVCTSLARAIEQTSGGWLTAGRLQDPAMQTLLEWARPTWRFEPTLVEVQGERVRAFTGLRLRTKLLAGLGPRRAARIAQLLLTAGASLGGADRSRRRLLQRGAALLTGLAIAPQLGTLSAYAAGTPTGATTSSPVAANDPVIGQLKASTAAQSAGEHFGAANWSAVQKIGRAGLTAYLIPLVATGQSVALVIGDPAAHQESASAVIQLAAAGNAATVTWRTAEGGTLGSTVFRDGRAVTTAASSTVSPDISMQCIINCIGAGAGNCVDVCASCAVTGPFSLDCIACGACAGADVIGCVIGCRNS